MALTHYDEKTFAAAEADGVTALIDFYADWCGPCKMLAPIIEQLSQEVANDVVVGKVNIDENPVVAQKYGVMSIPTVIVLKNGKELERSVGFASKAKLLSMLENA